MLRLFLISTFMTFSVSCASRLHDKQGDFSSKESVSLYSNADSRSTLKADKSVGDVIKQLKASLEKNPRDSKAWNRLAELYLVKGDLKSADLAVKKSLRYDIKNLEAKLTMAKIELRRERLDLAEVLLSHLGGFESKSSEVLNVLAMVQMRKGETSQAMTLFKKALRIQPDSVPVRMNLGVSYLSYRNLPAAAVQFERVLKISPSHLDAKIHLASIKHIQGDTETAEEYYEEVLSAQKHNPLALYNYAVLQKNNKNYDEALDHLKTYLKTSYARNAQTDAVFALIESIKTAEASSGEQAISDEEIQKLAYELEDREMRQQNSNQNQGVAPSSDAELESLERELLE